MEGPSRGFPINITIMVAAVSAAVVIVVVGAAALMAFGALPIPGPIFSVLSGAKSPEHSASYYPPETSVYAWLTLAPGGGQFDQARDDWDRLNEISEFRDLYDSWVEEFEDDLDYDFEDLKEWAGPDLSAAVVVQDWDEEPMAALTIGVRDQDAAEEFLDTLLDDIGAGDFESDSYEGFDTWVDESGWDEAAYGLSGDFLVFASSEDFLEEVIDGINGDLKETLADDQDFQAARSALAEPRFASVYVVYEDASSYLDQELYWGLPQPPVAGLGPDPGWVAASASWGDRSIAAEVVLPSLLDHSLDFPDLDVPAGMVPEDAWFLVSAAFDPNLDNWRATLEEYEIADVGGDYAIEELNEGIESLEYQLDISGLPTASRRSGFDFFIDLGIEVFDEWTGVDLEEDLFDHLEGQVSVAGWDFSLDEYGEIEVDRPPSVAILLAYDEGGEDTLADAAEEILDLLEDEADIRFEEVDVGADLEALVHYPEYEEYSPGYVLSRGQWVFGLTEDTLADAVELQREGGDALDSNAQYRRALDLLPGVRHGLAYANLNEIIRQLDPDDLEIYVDGEYLDGQAILEEAIGSAAVSYTLGNQKEDTLDRYAVVLTLFPE